MSKTDAQTVLEISTGFLLDQLRFARQLLDVVDMLLIVAVTQANVDPLMRDPALQRAYAAYDTPPPDALRRPISVNALAYSLRLPFETVRRRLLKLTLLGVFKTSPDGLYVPTARVQGERHRRVVETAYAGILTLYEQLSPMKAFRDLADPRPRPDEPPPVRAAARISGQYVLRLVDIVTARMGDPVDAAIWLEVLRSSAEAGGEDGERGFVPSNLVARRLGLPSETVRRRVLRLAEIGACGRGPNGVTVSRARVDEPDFAGLAQKNLVYLRRMFAELAQLGAREDRPARLAT